MIGGGGTSSIITIGTRCRWVGADVLVTTVFWRWLLRELVNALMIVPMPENKLPESTFGAGVGVCAEADTSAESDLLYSRDRTGMRMLPFFSQRTGFRLA